MCNKSIVKIGLFFLEVVHYSFFNYWSDTTL